MFQRSDRLRKEREIMRVYQQGRGAGTEQIGLKMLPNQLGANRWAFVVSKKVDKRAVVRNRNRRRLAAIAQTVGETYLSGCDIVVTVRQDLAGLSHAELTRLLVDLLQRSARV